MGLRVGKQVQLLRKQNHGPILLKVDEARIAIGRALVAIMENYQKEDGSIAMPNVLLPFMNGKKVIESL